MVGTFQWIQPVWERGKPRVKVGIIGTGCVGAVDADDPGCRSGVCAILVTREEAA